jgi:NAD(P)-dependent dehydrogenase (short-subunit alcohol dehydrogenase family)
VGPHDRHKLPRPALHHPRRPTAPAGAAEEGPREVADIVNISSIAGRVARNGYGVYSLTKFGVNGFTESLRQEVTRRHVRVGVVEPGGVATELGTHTSARFATR